MIRNCMIRIISVILSVAYLALPGGARYVAPDYSRLKVLFEDGNFNILEKETSTLLDNGNLNIDDWLRVSNFNGMALLNLNRIEDFLTRADCVITKHKPDSLLYWDLKEYVGMSDILCTIGLYDAARIALERGGECALRLGSVSETRRNTSLAQYWLSVSQYNSMIGNFVEAIRAWTKAGEYVDGSPSLGIIWNGEGGYIYELMGDTSTSERYFRRALDFEPRNINQLTALIHCAGFLNDRSHYAASLNLLYSRQDLMELSVYAPLQRRDLLRAEGEALQGIGEYSLAAGNFRRVIELSDSLNIVNDRLKNSMMAENINPDDYASLKNAYVLSSKKIAWLILSVSVICWIIIICCHYIAGEYRVKRRRDIIKTMTFEYDQLLLKERQSDLESQLDESSRTACESALRMASINEGLREIRREVISSSKGEKERLRAINASLRSRGMYTSSAMDKFNLLFSKVRQEFVENLTRLAPDLSKTELEICNLLLLGWTAKEIASMTGRSHRTVESVVYSVRKKLKVTGSTEVWLRRVSGLSIEQIENLKKQV